MKKFSELRPSLSAFFLMMAMATTTSALSFFVSPVCEELGLGRGSFTIYYSLMTASSAAGISFLGQFISKKGVRPILLIAALWTFVGLMLFSFSGSLWMFYAVATVMGVFSGSCANLCANVIVQQSYTSSQAAGVLGVVMAGSGVGGMIFSLIVPGLIENLGWRMSYRVLAVCWLGLVLTAFFLVGKQSTSQNSGPSKLPVSGMSRAEALRSPKLYLMMILIVAFYACCGIQQQLPSLLAGMEFDTGEVSLLVSVMTAGLAVGKIFQGMLYSRIGVKKGGVIMAAMFAAGNLLLMSKPMIYPALICLSFGMGLVTTLIPTIARFVFGAREFASIWSLLATVGSVATFITTPVWGMVYDGFGSYTPALIVSAILIVIATITMLMALKDVD